MYLTKKDVCECLLVSERTPIAWLADLPRTHRIGSAYAYNLLDLIPRIRRRPRGLKGAELQALFDCARERGVGPDEDTLYLGEDSLGRARLLLSCLTPAERDRWYVAATIFESCLVESPGLFVRPVFREMTELREKLVLDESVAAYVFLNQISDLPERLEARLAVEFAITNARLSNVDQRAEREPAHV